MTAVSLLDSKPFEHRLRVVLDFGPALCLVAWLACDRGAGNGVSGVGARVISGNSAESVLEPSAWPESLESGPQRWALPGTQQHAARRD